MIPLLANMSRLTKINGTWLIQPDLPATDKRPGAPVVLHPNPHAAAPPLQVPEEWSTYNPPAPYRAFHVVKPPPSQPKK